MTKTDFIYTTYIRSTPEKIWEAITNPEFTRQYWVNDNISDWKKGSEWKHVLSNGTVRVVGKVLETDPPKRLVLSWSSPDKNSNTSQVTFEIEAAKDMTCLRVTHKDLVVGSDETAAISRGWPLVLSNLKSFLETGKTFDLVGFKGECK